ncbi:MAG TPA: hypothetical protein VMI32_21820 [Candidatus Solibacter sp.]|nr:hypothetical protein [Candidatus Solibacter sp.]
MIPADFPRSVAIALLRFAIWIAPHDTLDWGRGMLSELHHVEGNWSALLWAVGGAGVLAKHALVALIFPKANRSILPSGGDLFSKESPVRKTALAITAACIAASLLFFLAPVFRQAFRISLVQWRPVVHFQPDSFFYRPTPYSESLARSVEQNHDAEGLAFVAIRNPNPEESVRMAEQAVHLDPSLTWVYGVIAPQYSSFSHFDSWVADLEKYDSQNALPHLIVAEKIDLDEVVHSTAPHIFTRGIMSGSEDHKSSAWQSAMAAAFQSSKLDTYLDRVKALDRIVLLRYHIDDPYEALTDEYSWWRGLPSYSAWDSSIYAKSILASAEALEARGDFQSATEKYFSVARFGQMMGPAGFFWVPRVQQQAYERLVSLSENNANKEQAMLYAALAQQVDQSQKAELLSMRVRVRQGDISGWNATVAKTSGLLLLFSALLLLACALAVIVRSRSLRLTSLHPGNLTLALGLGGAIGSVLGSFLLYVSYRPYAEILQDFIRSGDDSRIPQLSEFLASAQVPLGAQDFISVRQVAVDFWFALTVLCVFALSLAVVRHFQTRPRPAAAA